MVRLPHTPTNKDKSMTRRKYTHRRLIVAVQQRGGDKSRHAVIESHAREVMAQLTSARLANTMRLTIKIRAKVTADNARGICHFRDMSRTATARSKHYTIILRSSMSFAAQLDVLTHELQHAVQMAKGRLVIRHTKAKGWAWYWRPVGHQGASICIPFAELPVWAKRPWEIEAIAAQRRLAHLARRNSLTKTQRAWCTSLTPQLEN